MKTGVRKASLRDDNKKEKHADQLSFWEEGFYAWQFEHDLQKEVVARMSREPLVQRSAEKLRAYGYTGDNLTLVAEATAKAAAGEAMFYDRDESRDLVRIYARKLGESNVKVLGMPEVDPNVKDLVTEVKEAYGRTNNISKTSLDGGTSPTGEDLSGIPESKRRRGRSGDYPGRRGIEGGGQAAVSGAQGGPVKDWRFYQRELARVAAEAQQDQEASPTGVAPLPLDSLIGEIQKQSTRKVSLADRIAKSVALSVKAVGEKASDTVL